MGDDSDQRQVLAVPQQRERALGGPPEVAQGVHARQHRAVPPPKNAVDPMENGVLGETSLRPNPHKNWGSLGWMKNYTTGVWGCAGSGLWFDFCLFGLLFLQKLGESWIQELGGREDERNHPQPKSMFLVFYTPWTPFYLVIRLLPKSAGGGGGWRVLQREIPLQMAPFGCRVQASWGSPG